MTIEEIQITKETAQEQLSFLAKALTSATHSQNLQSQLSRISSEDLHKTLPSLLPLIVREDSDETLVACIEHCRKDLEAQPDLGRKNIKNSDLMSLREVFQFTLTTAAKCNGLKVANKVFDYLDQTPEQELSFFRVYRRAAENDYADFFKVLISRCPDVKQNLVQQVSILRAILRKGAVSSLEYILNEFHESGEDLSLVDELLQSAMFSENIEVFQKYLEFVDKHRDFYQILTAQRMVLGEFKVAESSLLNFATKMPNATAFKYIIADARLQLRDFPETAKENVQKRLSTLFRKVIEECSGTRHEEILRCLIQQQDFPLSQKDLNFLFRRAAKYRHCDILKKLVEDPGSHVDITGFNNAALRSAQESVAPRYSSEDESVKYLTSITQKIETLPRNEYILLLKSFSNQQIFTLIEKVPSSILQQLCKTASSRKQLQNVLSQNQETSQTSAVQL